MPISKLRPTYTMIEDRIEQLRTVVPEAFADGKINWETLKEVLGDYLEDGDAPQAERFGLFWPGKREARRLANLPSSGTLVPQPGEGVDEDSTRNVFIEGDNLEVLKLLRKAYAGRVKMIYIDPPYNTGNDFVYKDDYSEPLESYLRRTGQADERGELLTTNRKAGGRFHSNWLNMMYPRLMLARELLREDGAICVSIGEVEHADLKHLLDEAFSEENYRNSILVRRYDKNLNRQFMEQGLKTLNVGAEVVLVYAKSPRFNMNPVYRKASEKRQTTGYWKGFWNAPNRPTMRYPLFGVQPDAGQWKWKEEKALEAVENYRCYRTRFSDKISIEEYWETTGRTQRFIRRNPSGAGKNLGVEHWIPPSKGILRSSNWTDVLASQTLASMGLEFDNPKNRLLIENLIRLCSGEEDIVVDFFAGSCTTAQAVLELNRKDGGNRGFIMVQLPEPTPEGSMARNAGYDTIAEIGKERIRRVIARMKEEGDGQLDLPARETPEDLGFKCFRLARSHFKQWTGYEGKSIAALLGQFDQFETPLVDGWQPEDLLVEILLQEGFPLDSAVERQKAFSQNAVYRVESEFYEHRLWVCLDSTIAQDTILRLDLADQDVFVCLDSALTDGSKLRLDDRCNVHVI